MLASTPAQEEFNVLCETHGLTYTRICELLQGFVSEDTVKSWLSDRTSARARNIQKTTLFILKTKIKKSKA